MLLMEATAWVGKVGCCVPGLGRKQFHIRSDGGAPGVR